MGRYQNAYCPNCGALSFRCQCGVSQPVGSFRPPAAQMPQRGFIQTMPPPPPRQIPLRMRQPAHVGVAVPTQQMPQQLQIRQTMYTPVEAILQMPEVAVRVQEMINEQVNSAVAETAARYGPAGQAPQTYDAPTGIPVEQIDTLYRMPLEAIPGAPPNNNTGGRLNAYKQGRQEVFDVFNSRLRDIIAAVLPSEFVNPELPADAGNDQPAGSVPDLQPR